MIASALLVAAVLAVCSGAPAKNDYYYHVESSSQSYSNKPAGCCYNGTALIKPGETLCADVNTAIQCVKSTFFWFPVLQMIQNKTYDCKGKVVAEADRQSCTPKNCLYQGKLAKLDSVIIKEINATQYKIVYCLKNGAVKMESGMCVDGATGKKNEICKKFPPKNVIGGGATKAPKAAADPVAYEASEDWPSYEDAVPEPSYGDALPGEIPLEVEDVEKDIKGEMNRMEQDMNRFAPSMEEVEDDMDPFSHVFEDANDFNEDFMKRENAHDRDFGF